MTEGETMDAFVSSKKILCYVSILIGIVIVLSVLLFFNKYSVIKPSRVVLSQKLTHPADNFLLARVATPQESPASLIKWAEYKSDSSIIFLTKQGEYTIRNSVGVYIVHIDSTQPVQSVISYYVDGLLISQYFYVIENGTPIPDSVYLYDRTRPVFGIYKKCGDGIISRKKF